MFKIAVLNTRNDEINRNGGIRLDGIDNASLLANHINNNDYLFISTQELTKKISNRIKTFLIDYKLYGKSRLDRFWLIKKIFSLECFNESNSIITDKKVIKERNYLLPFIPHNFHDLKVSIKKPALMPRMITTILIDDNKYGKICVINTHLDYYIKSIQKRQLKKLIKIIKKNKKYPIILTGDFNMEIGNIYFDDFIEKIKKFNLKRIEINDKTNSNKHRNKSAIDHIFISNEFRVLEFGLIDDTSLNGITDHNGLFATLEK